MNKYEINTEKKKKNIINTSLELFSMKGFSDVTIKEIATLANVSQVSIYNYFGSKEALITGCVDIVMENIYRTSENILHMNISFEEKMTMLLEECTNGANLSFSEKFSEHALKDPSLIRLLTININKRKRELYYKFVEAGKSEGIISSTISTDTLLDFIDSINSMDIPLNKSEATTKIQNIYHLLLYGIIGK